MTCEFKFRCLTDCSEYEKIIKGIDSVMHIQMREPSVKTDAYMRGLANGMIMVESIIKKQPPKFFDKTGEREL